MSAVPVVAGHSPTIRGTTRVVINKPTIIDGEWRDVPTVVHMERGRVVADFPVMAVRHQLREAVLCFAVLVVTVTALWPLADWLRYST